ncbi:MAG: fimbria/pilus periplasmic chaperone [Bacteroidales bacterium]|nr:fimbria/pilus periplasmic chaperone [Bacteroidales bacterium]
MFKIKLRVKQIARIRSNIIPVVLVFILLLCLSAGIFAQGNLLLTPRRVVFDGSTRSIDLNLANTGQDSATYAISIVQIRMTEEGQFETITEPDPGQRFADRFIRYFPRSVTLAPGEAQVIKVQVTRRSQLEEGEYRSHFYFRAVPDTRPLGEEEPAQVTDAISVQLTPIFGITIPVIIRVGESNTTVSLSDLELRMVNDSEPQLELIFNRSGNMSAYGNLAVDHVSPSGTVTRVGIANGIAVYTPNTKRKFILNLVKSEDIDYTKGRLRIIYSAPSDVRPETYAESELMLN